MAFFRLKGKITQFITYPMAIPATIYPSRMRKTLPTAWNPKLLMNTAPPKAPTVEQAKVST